MKTLVQNISIECAVKALSCLYSARVVYLSTPVTGGPLILCDNGMTRDQIIAKNLFHSEVCAKDIAFKTSAPVINPARFMMQDWPQDAYIHMWKEVIASVATEVWFNEGWEYSNGCAQEYLRAIECGLETFDYGGKILRIDDAIDALSRAIELLNSRGISVMILEIVLKGLAATGSGYTERGEHV